LEIKPSKRSTIHAPMMGSNRSSVAASPVHLHPAAAESDYFGRLHPRHAQRTSDPTMPPTMPPQLAALQAQASSYRSPKQGGSRIVSLPVAPAGLPAPIRPSASPQQPASPVSHYTLTPPTSWAPNSTSTSAASWANAATAGLDSMSSGAPSLSLEPAPRADEAPQPMPQWEPETNHGPPIRGPPLTHMNKRMSSSPRYTDYQAASRPTNDYASFIPRSYAAPAPQETTAAPQHLPTSFDNYSLPAPQNPVLPPPTKASGKLTKAGGGKLLKKNRFSIRAN
jgi:hypothetical protein